MELYYSGLDAGVLVQFWISLGLLLAVQVFLEIQDTIKKQKISHFALSLIEICNKLNINNVTPKSFHRWFKTELSKHGIRVEFIKRMMGHAIDVEGTSYEARVNKLYKKKIDKE